MRVKEKVFEKHRLLELDVLSDKALIELAQEQAKRKSAHVHVDDPSGRSRSNRELFSQNFLGVVADLACAEVLRLFLKKYHVPAIIIRYDDVRTDDFRNPDEYDVKVACAGKELYVEVRSSTCCLIPYERMLREWQVLGPYASASKGSSEAGKHFYFRPLYHFSRTPTTKDYERADGAQHLLDGRLKLYLVGGASEELLRSNGRQERGQQLKQSGANYWVLDILDAMDVPTLLETIKARLLG